MIVVLGQSRCTFCGEKGTLNISTFCMSGNIGSSFEFSNTSLKAVFILCVGRNNTPCIRENILEMFLFMNEQISSTTAHEDLDSTNAIHAFDTLHIGNVVVRSTDEESVMGHSLLGSSSNFRFQCSTIGCIWHGVWHV